MNARASECKYEHILYTHTLSDLVKLVEYLFRSRSDIMIDVMTAEQQKWNWTFLLKMYPYKDTWVAQSFGRLTRGCGIKPCIRLSTGHGACLILSLPLSIFPAPPPQKHMYRHSLSFRNKIKNENIPIHRIAFLKLSLFSSTCYFFFAFQVHKKITLRCYLTLRWFPVHERRAPCKSTGWKSWFVDLVSPSGVPAYNAVAVWMLSSLDTFALKL